MTRSTYSLVLNIWNNLNNRRRLQAKMLFVLMLLSGLAELVSLGAVLPFLSIISEPQKIGENSFVRFMGIVFGLTTFEQLVVLVTISFSFAAVSAAVLRIANLWFNTRFAACIGSDLSCESYKNYLFQPYEFHVKHNSSELITGSTTHIGKTVAALTVLLQLVTGVVVSCALISGLLIINWAVTLCALIIFGFIYFFLALTARKDLQINSKLIGRAAYQQIQALQEGLGSIQDVILSGNQLAYVNIYKKYDKTQRQLQAKNQFLSSYPRFAIEPIGIVLMAVLGCTLTLDKNSSIPLIPTLGAIALGAQRLLPALQQIYGNWAVLKSYNADLQWVVDALNQRVSVLPTNVTPYQFFQSIKLKNVDFQYDDGNKILSNFNLEIIKGERLGIVGVTGSGKSTAIDLIMGLLTPTSGTILIDDKDLYRQDSSEFLLAWRSSIAHVPQNIYLADMTISENIAFGVPRDQIDMKRVKTACQQARIADYIESNKEGYSSFVGERGIKLSGGQRQRMGIARALYKNSKVLILDEATSALDTDTEAEVMSTIDKLGKHITVIIIAHRLSTIQNCDRIVRISQGRITTEGTS